MSWQTIRFRELAREVRQQRAALDAVIRLTRDAEGNSVGVNELLAAICVHSGMRVT